jgi:hypothetical protein
VQVIGQAALEELILQRKVNFFGGCTRRGLEREVWGHQAEANVIYSGTAELKFKHIISRKSLYSSLLFQLVSQSICMRLQIDLRVVTIPRKRNHVVIRTSHFALFSSSFVYDRLLSEFLGSPVLRWIGSLTYSNRVLSSQVGTTGGGLLQSRIMSNWIHNSCGESRGR